PRRGVPVVPELSQGRGSPAALPRGLAARPGLEHAGSRRERDAPGLPPPYAVAGSPARRRGRGRVARVMNAVLFDVALTAYIVAAVAAAASLVGRREGL